MEKIIEREVVCILCKGKGVKATAWDRYVAIFTFGLPYMVGLDDCPKCGGSGKTTLRETIFEQNIERE